jgi:alkane 1-monooxygenase
MDPKVMEWAGGDITKVNVDPSRKARLYAKYGAKAASQPA